MRGLKLWAAQAVVPEASYLLYQIVLPQHTLTMPSEASVCPNEIIEANNEAGSDLSTAMCMDTPAQHDGRHF